MADTVSQASKSLDPEPGKLVFPVALVDKIPMDEKEYRDFEALVLQVLQNEGMNVPQKLFSVYLLTGETVRAKQGKSPPRGLDEVIKDAKQAGTETECPKARLIRGLFFSFLDRDPTSEAPKAGFGAMIGILRDMAKVFLNMGSVFLQRLNRSVSIPQVDKITVSPLRGEIDARFLEFFTGLVRSGWLGGQSSIHAGVCLMIVALSLGEWLVRALAAAAGRSAPTGEDLTHAMDFLQTEFGKRSTALTRMVSGSAFFALFDALMQRPSVACSLANLGREKIS